MACCSCSSSSLPPLELWTHFRRTRLFNCSATSGMLSLNIILIALPAAHAIALPKWHDLSRNTVPMSSPSQAWYHSPDHPVHALFRRIEDDGAVVYPPVGSSEWSNGFPPPGLTLPDPSTMPQAWVNALNFAVAADKIPNVPMSNITTPGTNPVYPNGLSPTSPQVCSGTYGCRIPGDIWDAPAGVFASAFDDGPTPSTPALVQFLQSNNVITTHFMIGSNILYYPNQFMTAFNAGHDIADHTFTHPYLTTKNNLDIVGELGWTMLLIANSTGGRLPKFWRPPYGDTDLRVSAIAKEVFSLTTVVWNHDSEDWRQNNPAPIVNNIQQFLTTSPKNPGLIILEHELSDITVNAFMNSFSMIKQNGWNFQSLAQAIGGGFSYLNAQNSSTNDVTPEPIVSSVSLSSSSSSSTASPSATAGSSTTNLTNPTPSSQANSGTSYPCPSMTLFFMTLFSVAIMLCS